MQFVQKNKAVLVWTSLYLILASFFIGIDQHYFALFPIGLIAIFLAIFYTENAFLLISFLTPFSINIEEYTDSLGLFIPTEPLLFILMFLLLFQQFFKSIVPREVWKSHIIQVVVYYLLWILITSMTSVHPVVSFKFLLSKLWFIVPLLIFGPVVFLKEKNIKRFLWLFCIAVILVVSYTLFKHSQYDFREKESHWIMTPFFKDHTIYGATLALAIPIIFGIYFSKKHDILIRLLLIGMIVISLLGLYFSYTRASWLSCVASLVVLVVIHLKIPFKIIALVLCIITITLSFSWNSIRQTLERNNHEHTTEQFEERIKSAANITTDASNLERINRWSSAFEMFKERPFLGFGPGTFAFEYARFQHPKNTTIISTNFGDRGNAHSEFLGALAEMGLIGLIGIGVVVTTIFYQSIKLYLRWPKEQKELRTLILSIILSLTGYFTHGLLNNFLDTDKVSVPIWGMCAIIVGLEIRLNRQQQNQLTG